MANKIKHNRLNVYLFIALCSSEHSSKATVFYTHAHTFYRILSCGTCTFWTRVLGSVSYFLDRAGCVLVRSLLDQVKFLLTFHLTPHLI